MGVGVVLLIGSTLPGADAKLVGEETRVTVTVIGVGVVNGVDRAGDAVAIADKVVSGTILTHVAHQSETFKALTGTSLGVVDGILSTDIDALVGS